MLRGHNSKFVGLTPKGQFFTLKNKKDTPSSFKSSTSLLDEYFAAAFVLFVDFLKGKQSFTIEKRTSLWAREII